MPGDLNWPIATPPSAMLTRVQGRAVQLRRHRRMLVAATPSVVVAVVLVLAAALLSPDGPGRRVRTIPADDKLPKVVVDGVGPPSVLGSGSPVEGRPAPLARSAPSAVSPVGGGDFDVTAAPSPPPSTRIAFSRAGEAIFTMRPDGSEVLAIPGIPPGVSPDWSPDGKRIVYQVTDSNEFDAAVVDADGRNFRRITNDQFSVFLPRWSPDGEHILFSAFVGFTPTVEGQNTFVKGQRRVHVVRADGSDMRVIGRAAALQADWSPDGTRIVYECNDPSELCVMSVDGSNDTVIPGTQGLHTPEWSPDGARLAVISGGVAMTMALDGSDRWVVQPRLSVNSLSWSPDGQRLAVSASEFAGSTGIYMVKADGAEAVRLTDGPTDLQPSFTRR